MDKLVELCNCIESARCAMSAPTMDGSGIRKAKEQLDTAHKLIPKVLGNARETKKLLDSI